MQAGEGHSNTYGFVVASISFVMIFVTAGSPIPLFNIYQSEYGISNADLGLVSVAYFIAAAVALLVLGRISDFIGRKKVAIIALMAAMLSCGLLFLIHGFWSLFAARLLQGLACGLSAGALTAFIVDTSSEKLRWLAAVITSSAPMIGIPIGAISCGFLILTGKQNWFLIYALVGIVLAALILLISLSRETVLSRKGVIHSLIPRLYLPKAANQYVLIASMVFLATWSLGGFYQAYGPALAHHYLGTDNPILAALVFAAIMILTPLGSPLSRFLVAENAVKTGMFIYILSLITILISLKFGFMVAFIVASLCVGLAQGLAVTGAMGVLIQITDQQNRAGLLSTIYLIAYCSAAIPALISSHFAYSMELLQIGYGYGVLGGVAALIAIVASRKKD
ncbi:MAG: MFS transporter [Proteobacteria bacterium]|uniref:MFS transporter n=1 Tax=Acinetobacter venetianus TaxID=52133 RepID=UPI0010A6083C|nr:MFS transporter [Acinetobacter venetianus]MCR4530378.1 MFS transporter [Acinetobacter venetianus]MDA0697367.1 MFS transporter [Pseudomonadota bacterium]MDA1253448.1 MFS transporter [Pseudomonadota bacterium]